ncbi:hypothetical protein EP30_00780 [Bifidobacterium sp. UTCIF-39]|uniref:beta-glucuronidase n=1 Tax=Bifidobacterium sp. UTCIF-39 TaxID=1465359 RepID=UPI001127E048|nr:beta-glucuronidase [Bifidobacterium sp. UTCIF-39]TPF97908.1 hypothetical protein EP30_00780 [Bifidobacterium sp. UTCIF-39]
MATISLDVGLLKQIRTVDPLMASYNIEMTEVTGGTFWKRYTPGQIAGTEPFVLHGIADLQNSMEPYPPKDLRNARLLALAKAIGPAWVRVSGSWASNTYYDFDGTTGGKAPEGFSSVLTRDQWESVLDFVKAIDGRLLVSVANSAGVHNTPDGSWDPAQAKLLFDFSRDYGVPIAAAEFMNEPNILTPDNSPLASGYGMIEYARDQDAFFRFLRENYPDVLCVGPCASEIGGPHVPYSTVNAQTNAAAGNALASLDAFSSDDLMPHLQERADVFSYHWYNGISERGASVLGNHWDASEAMGKDYLSVAEAACRRYLPMRDEYMPGAPMWITETADAGLGGDTWASTYLDVFRTACELGVFGELTDGVIFHNTLASSDYGWLDFGDFSPRPNYWFVLLWNRLMGTTVYGVDEGVLGAGGVPDDGDATLDDFVHVYARSRKDCRDGVAWLIVNSSTTESIDVHGVSGGWVYQLTADDPHARDIRLNGRPLALGPDDELPDLVPDTVSGDTVTLPPASIIFLVR